MGALAGEGARVTGAAGAPALGVGGAAVERAVLRVAVALGGHHDLLGGVAGDGPLQQEDVGLLAGLEDAELGVEGGPGGDHPVRPRLRAAAQRLDVEPRGEPLALLGILAGEVVDVEEGVRCGEVRGHGCGCSRGEGGGWHGTRHGHLWTCHGSSRAPTASSPSSYDEAGPPGRRAQRVFAGAPPVPGPPGPAGGDRPRCADGRLPDRTRPEHRGPRGLLGRAGAARRLDQEAEAGPRRRPPAVLPVVPRRHAEHLLQRAGPARRERPRRPHRPDPRLAGHGHPGVAHLRAAARAHRGLRRRPACHGRGRGRPGGRSTCR